MGIADEFRELEESCVTDGLLKRGSGGKLSITKKGREAVKLAAITDDEVAAALEEALRSRWLDRREELATVVLVARRARMPSMRDS